MQPFLGAPVTARGRMFGNIYLTREPGAVGFTEEDEGSLLVLASTRDLAVAAAVLVVTGLCAGAFDVLQQTLLQMAVPEEQRGRAAGIWVLGVGSAPIGNLEMGALIGVLGAPAALLINGGLAVASAATLLARSPHYRWKPRARPRSG